MAELSGLAALRALSLNHRNLGIGSLADVAVTPEALAEVHASLLGAGLETFVLGTCNRTEVYWRARGPGDDEQVLAAVASHLAGVSPAVLRTCGLLRGRAAAAHLFRVCCGIESLVLGEAEILGQVRAALETSAAAGSFIHGVVKAALRTGRMARAETTIGVGALSVASAAVQLVAATLPLATSRVVVVGAGATGVKAARHLHALGAATLVIANRTIARAEAVAAPFGGEAIGLDALAGELSCADAIICAVASPAPIISRRALAASLAARGGRPLTIVDLSMPPVVEAGEVAGVTRVDLGALEQQVERQRDRRAGEIPRVEAIVDRELRHLESWARHQALRPLVSELRRKVETIRRAELARAEAELGDRLDPRLLDRLSRRLLDQVLAIPLASLEAGHVPLDPAQAQYLRRLFALETGAEA